MTFQVAQERHFQVNRRKYAEAHPGMPEVRRNERWAAAARTLGAFLNKDFILCALEGHCKTVRVGSE